MRNNRALLISCFALAVVASAESNRRWSEEGLQIRGILDPPTTPVPDTPTSTADTTTTTADTTTADTTTTAATTTADTTTATTADPTTTKPTDTTTTTTPPTTTTTPTTSKADTTTTPPTTKPDDNNATTAMTTLPPATTHVVTTDGNGDAITVYTTYTPTPSAVSSSASPSSTEDSSNTSGEDKGISTGSIIGMSVAGGVALIGFACFVFWKFTRKRQSDFDDNEAIKWPELNTHTGDDSQPLPSGTGRFDDGSNLSRQDSNGTTGGRSYVGGASNYSTADLGPDPYGVPPLPHLNPNQNMPYRDDPAAGAYYDPYRGPVPQFGPIPGEAIPMGQMQYSDMAYGDPRVPSPMRTGSPAPLGAPQAYGLGAADQISRTGSPMRMASPGPGSAYGPGPQAAYDPVTFHGGR